MITRVIIRIYSGYSGFVLVVILVPKITQVIDFTMRKQPVQARSKALVESLLDATARLLVTSGYTPITTNKVAETAGVGIGSLYEYFPNKESLVAALIERNARDIIKKITVSMEVSLQMSHEKALRFWLESMVEALEERRDEVRVVITEVPFLQKMPLIQSTQQVLMNVALTAHQKANKQVEFTHPKAAVFHLTTMVSAAIINMVIHAPQNIPRAELLDELSELILRTMESS